MTTWTLPKPAGTRGEWARRISQLLAGLFLYGIGISLMVRAGIGVAPWDVLTQGISHRTGIPFGLVTNIEHRAQREAKTIAALDHEPLSLEALVPRVYDDVPQAVHGLAGRSLLAGLEKLVRDGIAEHREPLHSDSHCAAWIAK